MCTDTARQIPPRVHDKRLLLSKRRWFGDETVTRGVKARRSISSTDTPEIGCGPPVCTHTRVNQAALICRRKGQRGSPVRRRKAAFLSSQVDFSRKTVVKTFRFKSKDSHGRQKQPYIYTVAPTCTFTPLRQVLCVFFLPSLKAFSSTNRIFSALAGGCSSSVTLKQQDHCAASRVCFLFHSPLKLCFMIHVCWCAGIISDARLVK